MQPSNQRDFIPVVRGIARSQAQVEIRQNGYLIYSTVVPPGPFELSDVIPSKSGSDLHVRVLESNGASQAFIVPYEVPAIALRKGHLRYNLVAGQYRPANADVETPPVAQATVAYGLPWNLTAFIGEQWSRHYQATSAGLGGLLGSMAHCHPVSRRQPVSITINNRLKGKPGRFDTTKPYKPLIRHFHW